MLYLLCTHINQVVCVCQWPFTDKHKHKNWAFIHSIWAKIQNKKKKMLPMQTMTTVYTWLYTALCRKVLCQQMRVIVKINGLE